MVFSSYIFIFYFLPASLAAYLALSHLPQRARNLCLALAGYVFYGWADPRFVPLMFGTTLLDWALSLVVSTGRWWPRGDIVQLDIGGHRTTQQRTALVASVVSNLAVLGFFKYFNFGVDSYNALITQLGWPTGVWTPTLHVVLPLGISFYTFQSLSYIIDVYRGQARAMSNFIDFSCFVSMFPHLVAGPILQFSFLADQIRERSMTLDKFARGVAMFSLGLGKKVLIANPCGQVADTMFGAASLSAVDGWYGLAAYALQIYFDFSGYSDMAVGLGLMLGFVFAKNFDAPYRSASITEFWRRWHISLSTWLRDYLYIPLGGNRQGVTRTYRNLFLTMLLGGLWHGASWTFVIWGAIHGTALAIERLWAERHLFVLPRPLRVVTTLLVVCVAWVFFRATTLGSAVSYLGELVTAGPVATHARALTGVVHQPYYVCSTLLGVAVAWWAPQAWDLTRRLTWPRALWCGAVFLGAAATLFAQTYNPFIYYIF